MQNKKDATRINLSVSNVVTSQTNRNREILPIPQLANPLPPSLHSRIFPINELYLSIWWEFRVSIKYNKCSPTIVRTDIYATNLKSYHQMQTFCDFVIYTSIFDYYHQNLMWRKYFKQYYKKMYSRKKQQKLLGPFIFVIYSTFLICRKIN